MRTPLAPAHPPIILTDDEWKTIDREAAELVSAETERCAQLADEAIAKRIRAPYTPMSVPVVCPYCRKQSETSLVCWYPADLPALQGCSDAGSDQARAPGIRSGRQCGPGTPAVDG